MSLRIPFYVAVLLIPALAAGQTNRGVFSGTVRDTAQRPLVGADIAFPDLARSTRADDRGGFRVEGIPVGTYRVLVRNIGFAPMDEMITFAEGQTVERAVVLKRVFSLDTVVTNAPYRDPEMLEFEENRRLGLGHFVTRAELAKQEGRKMSEIVGQFPGVNIKRGPGSQAWLKSSHGIKSLTPPSCRPCPNPDCPLLEGLSPPTCSPECFAQVYLDNNLLSRGEVTDINRMIPAEVEAVEYYSGGAQTPQKYALLNSECGVIVFHTRRPP